MDSKIIIYKNVFSRENPIEKTFGDFLNKPEEIFSHFGIETDILSVIKKHENKTERNELKRLNLPAMDLSMSNILCIDIDNISDNEVAKTNIVERLKNLDSCFCIKETASGNLCAFFKYSCTVEDYPFLYYKLYLELTILLSVNIDFLPEIGRLRYVTIDNVFHINTSSRVITEILKVETLPYINTQTRKEDARRVVFGSN